MAFCPYNSCHKTGKCLYSDRAKELNCPDESLLGKEQVRPQDGFTIGREIEPGVVSAEFEDRLRVLGYEPKDPRYQHQSWLIRRWRDRYNLLIPFVAMQCWYHEHTRELEDQDDWRLTFGQCWHLAIGLTQGKKQHHFTSEELGWDFSEYVDDE
jgi:hypothetical protein